MPLFKAFSQKIIGNKILLVLGGAVYNTVQSGKGGTWNTILGQSFQITAQSLKTILIEKESMNNAEKK